MNLADVMTELGMRLQTIADLRVFDYPPGSLTPPAAVVSYPDEYEFDQTYGRGLDRMVIPIVVMVGKASDRTARDRLGVYCDGSGASSVKAVIDSGRYTSCDSAVVTKSIFDFYSIAGTEYLVAMFSATIVGKGK